MNKKILIIGAGLSGLYLAYRLKKLGFSIIILEANDRIGGRIYTKTIQNTKIELGATWLWRYNVALIQLCKELGINLFEQNMNDDALYEASNLQEPQRFQVPKNQENSYRIVGGTKIILDNLHTHLRDDELLFDEKVVSIKNKGKNVKILTKKSVFIADYVVSTLPPQLLVNSIEFHPKLDSKLVQIANDTHTWMHDSIKFAIIYRSPFWRTQGLSGVGFSNIGPFTEIYDHSDYHNKTFALMGFLHRNLITTGKIIREQNVARQLEKFFGVEARNYISYQEKIWNEEELLSVRTNTILAPHANNGNSIYQKKYFDNKLIFAGSETSTNYGGYMEGAILRGIQIVKEFEIKIKA